MFGHWKEAGEDAHGEPVFQHRSGQARVVRNGPNGGWFAEVKSFNGWIKARTEPFDDLVDAKDYAVEETHSL
jgi:hypothetical protein